MSTLSIQKNEPQVKLQSKIVLATQEQKYNQHNKQRQTKGGFRLCDHPEIGAQYLKALPWFEHVKEILTTARVESSYLKESKWINSCTKEYLCMKEGSQ